MKYNGNNLKDVLEAHKRWLYESDGYTDDNRADLRCANLNHVDLRDADLRSADLRGAKLDYADLRCACLINAWLIGADLSRANLSGAYLFNAYLFNAQLINANLRGADLKNAYLSDADLRCADLKGAKLNHADLRCADLRNADLRDADLSGTYFTNANLSGANNVPFISMTCPDTGSFIGWKKAYSSDDRALCIVKLLIPEDAKRSSSTNRKCRANKAVVIEIQTMEGITLDKSRTAFSIYNRNFLYRVGETVEPDEPFDEDRWLECASGIHFFINRQEAVNY